ncbi:MAG TPA: hypothetical protein VEI81_05500 [Methanoregula sp.]|nr:hypothetical protein [Methanoregula sp.]
MTSNTTRLINPHTGEMQCKICGITFYSAEKPLIGEAYYETEHTCPNGCHIHPGE